MADDNKAALEGLITSINNSIASSDAVLQAVQKQLTGNIEAAAPVTQDLIKNNTTPASAFEETLKLHKAMVEQTLKAINALGPDDKDDTKGGS